MRARNEPLPKIVVTSMTTDYLSLRGSLARTGATGSAVDAPIPANVGMYDVAGASHSLPGAATHANCSLPLAKLDYRPIMRSSLANLDAWVSRGIEPPESVLMPLTAASVDDKVLRAPAHLPKPTVLAPPPPPDATVPP